MVENLIHKCQAFLSAAPPPITSSKHTEFHFMGVVHGEKLWCEIEDELLSLKNVLQRRRE